MAGVLSLVYGWNSLPSARFALNRSGGLALRGGGGLRARAPRRAEGDREDVFDRVREDELELLARLFRKLGQVGLVVSRHPDPLEAVALRGEHLLANPADRQHLPGECDL